MMQHWSSFPICCGLALAVLAGPLGPAAGEPMTVADLEGTALQAEVAFDQTARRQGRTALVKTTQRWMLKVDPDRTVTFQLESTARSPMGTRNAEPSRGMFTLDESRQVMGTRGRGEGVWTFADGTLTFVRTLLSGAFRVAFALRREGDRLTCAVEASFARETGGGPVRLRSPYTGDEVTILQAKQMSSSCTVGKAIPASAPSQ